MYVECVCVYNTSTRVCGCLTLYWYAETEQDIDSASPIPSYLLALRWGLLQKQNFIMWVLGIQTWVPIFAEQVFFTH